MGNCQKLPQHQQPPMPPQTGFPLCPTPSRLPLPHTGNQEQLFTGGGGLGCGEPVKPEGDGNEEGHPQVCAKCCAQFSNPTEFLTHQNECCTDPLVMVVIGDQEKPNNSSASSASRPGGHSRSQVMDTEVNNSPDSGRAREERSLQDISWLLPQGQQL